MFAMETKETVFGPAILVPTNEVQLQRLNRNLRDIAQLYNKFSSYLCEPKTYEHYWQFNHLQDSATELRDSNLNILQILKTDHNALVRCSRMLIEHLKNFNTFRNETLSYFREVRSHRMQSS